MGRKAQVIDEAMARIGQCCQIRLVVKKGCLHFIVTQQGLDALEWS